MHVAFELNGKPVEVDIEPRIAVKDRNLAIASGRRQDRSRGWRRKDDCADWIDDAMLVAGSKRNPIRFILEWRRDIDSCDRIASERHANRARHVRA